MSLDGLSLSLLVTELDILLRGGRIEKVFQPDYYTLVLWIRTPGKTVRLVLSADPRKPRMLISTGNVENPGTPPTFCMLLRKHLDDGRIQSIMQHGLDRTVMINIDVREEAGAITVKTLVVELMGKHSNIILIHNETILDSVRRVGIAMSRLRQVLPGRKYCLPPGQERMNLLSAPLAEFLLVLKNQSGQLSKAIMNTAMGLGPASVKEFLWRANIHQAMLIEEMTEDDWSRLGVSVESVIDPVSQKVLFPHVHVNELNKVTGIAGFELRHLTDQVYDFTSMSQAVDFASNLITLATPEKERLQKFISNELSRLYRKHEIIVQEFAKANAADDLRRCGDILMTYLPDIQQGQSAVELPDIYADQTAQQTVRVELDTRETPLRNAQMYYNRYNKQKRAQYNLETQLEQIEQETNYLESVNLMLEHAQSAQETREIEQELVAGGYLAKGKKKRTEPVSAPLTILLDDGSTITIGKNNRQNDIVTFKYAHANDLWFHTKDIPGSHVVLRASNDANANAIRIAAIVAAYFSKARQSSNVPVDYTLRRNVKKPSGAKPGFVIYDKQNTIFVTPEAEIITTLLKNKK